MIEIRKINKFYNKHHVLNDLDLIVNTGVIQALLGANGAGKTTLIKIIADLIDKESGKIYIDNVLIQPKEYKYRKNIGYVFEENLLIERLTATEYLKFVGEFYWLDKTTLNKRADELITFFDLDPGKKLIEDYSKGMKSKISLAAALIHNPKYLILDEPFDGIDFLSIQKIRKLFRDLATNGCTILIASHQYDIMSDVCDKFALLREGEILFNYTMVELEEISSNFCNSKEPVKSYLESKMSIQNNSELSWINLNQ